LGSILASEKGLESFPFPSCSLTVENLRLTVYQAAQLISSVASSSNEGEVLVDEGSGGRQVFRRKRPSSDIPAAILATCNA